MLRRLFNTLLVRPEDLAPSDERLKVVSAFNPGAAAVSEREVVLLVRVAEAVAEKRPGYVGLPRYEEQQRLAIDWLPEERVEFVDPRVVKRRADGLVRLTFVSHLRVARLDDGGRRVASLTGPRFMPKGEFEEFGVEDPRITALDGRFYFTYVTVSRHGAATALASTTDFDHFQRHGVIFPVENKDVVLFPEQLGGQYLALHRPNGATPFTIPEMWLGRSPDLVHWGGHEHYLGGQGSWETGRIGAGPPPVRTERGYLEMYHANNKKPGEQGVGLYSASLVLSDDQEPHRILGHSDGPVMVPEADFERAGFVPQIVFPTGIVERGDEWLVYYGAADAFTAVTSFARKELLGAVSK